MSKTSALLAALLLIFMTQAMIAQSNQCPTSHLDVTDRFKVSGDSELIPTFAYIQSKIDHLEPVEYTTSTAQYRLFDIRPMLIYQAQYQRSQVLGNDTLVVYNGSVTAEIIFSWIKNNNTSQIFSAKAIGKSQPLAYSKQIYQYNSTLLRYIFLDADAVVWDPNFNPWKLLNLAPDNITQQDLNVLLSIAVCSGQFCKENQKKAFRNQLTEAVNKVFIQYLNATISGQHYKVTQSFNFNWRAFQDDKVKRNITMSRNIARADLYKDNTLELQIDTRVVDDEKFWKCPEKSIPVDAAQPSIYGQNQEFVSYDFVKSFLIYEIRKGYLDQTLSKDNWGYYKFKFTAGQFFGVFPLLAERYKPEEAVTGQCRALQSDLDAYHLNKESFAVQIGYSCSLFIQRSRFSNFLLQVHYEISGWIWEQMLRLGLGDYSFNVKFYPYADYKIGNLTQAEAIIKDLLRGLYNQEIYPSAYPFANTKIVPKFVVEKDFIRVYDQSYMSSKQEQIEATKVKLQKKTLKENTKKMLTLDQ